MIVTKRDGRTSTFQPEKIVNAIRKAFKEVDGEISPYALKISLAIADYVQKLDIDLSVEEIQDIVEEELMATDRKDVARAYVIYRNDRSKVRRYNTDMMKNFTAKIKADDVDNQNANVDGKSFGGRIGAASDEVMKQHALDECMSKLARDNHLNNEIYTHDLSHYPAGDHNCLSIPFDDLLANGFNTRQTDVRPAQSINTACQLIAVISQLQSLQQFGGVSATHIDWTLAPYVQKSFAKHYIFSVIKDSDEFKDIEIMEMIFDTYEDEIGITRNKFDDWLDEHKKECLESIGLTSDDLKISNKNSLDKKHYQSALLDTVRETKQAIEALYHNLNTLQSRSGNQLPFTSINYGTCTSDEGRLVTKMILDVSISGIGMLHRTSIFPCGIFQCMKGVNRKSGEPNYDLFRLALRSTAQRLYPNYANVDWSGNEGYDANDPKTYFSTMG